MNDYVWDHHKGICIVLAIVAFTNLTAILTYTFLYTWSYERQKQSQVTDLIESTGIKNHQRDMDLVEAIVTYQQPWNRLLRQFKRVWRDLRQSAQVLWISIK